MTPGLPPHPSELSRPHASSIQADVGAEKSVRLMLAPRPSHGTIGITKFTIPENVCDFFTKEVLPIIPY